MCLASDHVGLAHYWANRLAGPYGRDVDVDDLIGAAMVGLVEAAERYVQNGVPFASWATRLIKQRVGHEIERQLNRGIRLPAGTLRQVQLMRRTCKHFPDIVEVKRLLGLKQLPLWRYGQLRRAWLSRNQYGELKDERTENPCVGGPST